MISSKKVLSMLLCGLIVIGGGHSATLVKADATSSNTMSKSAQGEVLWRQGVRFKLRAKHNTLYKDWWEINLVCNKNGVLSLEGRTDIPSNLTFDDYFVMGFNDSDKNGITRIPFEAGFTWGSTADLLRKEMNDFNNAQVKVGEPIFIHGLDWDGTLRFAKNSLVIKNHISSNDYTAGYRSVDKYCTGFYVKHDGLHEAVFMHDRNGIKY